MFIQVNVPRFLRAIRLGVRDTLALDAGLTGMPGLPSRKAAGSRGDFTPGSKVYADMSLRHRELIGPRILGLRA
ncbi:MAG: hypothetical protein ACI8PT_004189 [Gammaproteobacteria bacterium]|jgi:hypothetical protein